MRGWIVSMVVVVAACKGGKDKASPGQAAAAKAAVTVPKVAVATVLAKDEGAPPYLLLVDDTDRVRVAAAASWADLDANKLKITKKPVPLDYADRYMREDFALGRRPTDTIASLDEYGEGGVEIDLAALEDDKPNLALDDPPPPEEEDKPDDGADESGGTGTAMALEEGKMGKQDSDRAEGQYKMQKNQEDPQLARQQAIEQARAAGILGSSTVKAGYVGLDQMPNEDGTPARVAKIEGAVVQDGRLERLRAMIFIAPTAKATRLIDAVNETDSAIAVSHAGKIRPLRLQFGARYAADPGSEFWLEARVSAKGIVIEAVPDAPITVDSLDNKAIAAALEKARTTRGADENAPVDILVDADVDAQRLIDVVVALDTAGVRMIGMGPAPSVEELARRGKRVPRAVIGQPNAMGDLDKAVIRRVVKSNLHKVQGCYDKALLEKPQLAGTVQVQFFIAPTGKVASSTASGVDPDLATCIADAIKTLEFPKPKGGGGVQVNYPFTMRP